MHHGIMAGAYSLELLVMAVMMFIKYFEGLLVKVQ